MNRLCALTNVLPAVLSILALSGPVQGQGSAADYRRAEALPGAWSELLRNAAIEVRWLDSDTPVYRYTHAPAAAEPEAGPRADRREHEVQHQRTEWRTVDLETGEVRPLFDEGAMVDAFAALVPPVAWSAERIVWFEALETRLLLMLRGDARIFTWDAASEAVDEVELAALPDGFRLAPVNADRSRSGGPSTFMHVVNAGSVPVRLVWLDDEARARPYATIAPGMSHRQHTYAGHAWRVLGEAGDDRGSYVATVRPGIVIVGDDPVPPVSAPDAPERRRRTEFPSPNGRFTVSFAEHQVVLHDVNDGTQRVLTDDGGADDRYEGPVHWSPDGSRFVVMRTVPGERRTVHVVESAPRDQLQPKLLSFRYAKPGDRIDESRPRLFDARSAAAIEIDDAPIEQPWSVTRVEWSADSSRFYYLYNARGHRTLRYVAVDGETGAATIIAEEHSDTFIDWTNKIFVHRLEETGELIWMSQRSGWNHLYLIDLESGAVRRAITSAEWVVRGVERVDESRREILLRVMGVHPDEDPYHVHYARVGLEESGITMLTEGDGTHRISLSPDGRHFVDVWSRADLPPVTEIRRMSDGGRVAILAEADDALLRGEGWSFPERFTAPGRDGSTEIWGLIHLPIGFDPERAYPVIESIYAGPHGQHVPKAFSVWSAARSLAELGFIVVQIDGMGTNWRSKAFHDVAHRNLADAGFPDRIAWLRAAATTRSWMDLSRVGVYGGSAGGQNALGALLFHGDFYHVAVADCGCHDNRMDKIWWNEQWMGWPVDEAYEANSNVTHAHRLEGKLLLTVGEVDRNVDPASTMQVVDALIRADKDFDLIVFPGVGHGALGSPYGVRRMRDFFVRHLHGVEPRWE